MKSGMHDAAMTADSQVINEICVAICTRDRTDQLRRALDSLMAQISKPAEILVVDNAPGTAATHDLVRDVFPSVRYIEEPVPGLDFARNRALMETSREIVAFMDDDVVTDPAWAGAIQAVFSEDPGIAVCTGKVQALSLDSAGARLFEDNGGFARGDIRIQLPSDRKRRLHGIRTPLIAWAISVGSGCSLAIRRQIVLDIGGFDEALDVGTARLGGGDHDIIWRSLDAGYQVIYEPSVRALHEHRSDVDASIEQIIEHNRLTIAMLTKVLVYAQHFNRLSVLAFLCWRLVKPGIRIIRRMAGRDPLPVAALLRMWAGCWGALGSYAAARRVADRRREVMNGNSVSSRQ